MKRSNQKRGFTIVEMVIVIAVVAVLAAVLIPTYSNIVKKANNSAYEQEKTNQQLIDATEEIERLQAENKSLEDIQKEYGSWDNIEAEIKAALAGITVQQYKESGAQNITIKVPESGDVATSAADISAAVKTAVEKAMEKISTGGSGLTAEQLEMIVKNVVENSTNVTESDVTYVNNSYYTTETKNVIEVGSLIGQMNNIIIKKGASKVITPGDAEALLLESGLDISKLDSIIEDGYRVAYDSDAHRFCFVHKNDDGQFVSTSNTNKLLSVFVFVDNTVDLKDYNDRGFSTYLTAKFNSTTVTTNKGIDTGKANVTTVTYTNTGDAQDVVIRTNSASTNLTVNAPLDTINHYGSAGVVDLQRIATTSYFEHGPVAFVELAVGRIVLTETSDVEVINVTKKDDNTYYNPIIADGGVKEENMPEIISRDQVNVTDSSGKTPLVQVQKTDAEGKVTGTVEQVYAYASGTAGTTEKTSVQNTTIASTLGIIVLDSNGTAGEKAYATEDKEEKKDAVVGDAVKAETKAKQDNCVHTFEKGVCTICGYTESFTGAKVGDTIYELVDEAIEKGIETGEIVIIGDDCVLSFNSTYAHTVPVGKSLTIDINGKNIKIYSLKKDDTSAFIFNLGSLTLLDNTANSSGIGNGKVTMIISDPDLTGVPGYASNFVRNHNMVTIKSGQYENQGTGQACYVVDNDAENAEWKISSQIIDVVLNIEGGLFTSAKHSFRQYLDTEGARDNKVTITGGDIYSYWVQDNNGTTAKGTLTINNAVFNSLTVGYYDVSQNFKFSMSNSVVTNLFKFEFNTSLGNNSFVLNNNTITGFLLDYNAKIITSGTFIIEKDSEISMGWIYVDESTEYAESYGADAWAAKGVRIGERYGAGAYQNYYQGYLNEIGQQKAIENCVADGYKLQDNGNGIYTVVAK